MAITADDYQVQIELASASNVAADSIVNTFAVKALDGSASFSALAGAFTTFYTSLAPELGTVLAGSANAHHFRLYHLSEPEPRPPVYTSRFTRAGTGTPLPSEVSICSSIAASAPAGQRPARRRGRVFLGPLNINTGEVVGGYLRPKAATMNNIANATETLNAFLQGINWRLCVWSRADNTLFPVVRGWVNNEYDTQRRRGPEATARQIWG